MVNNKDFGKRIQKIMDYHAVSASSFADYMGVGRSSISHILSGRNKPSLDFVMKIVDAYTDVDLQWLLYGKGTFPKSENVSVEKKNPLPNTSTINQPTSAPTTISKQDLFSQSSPEEKTATPNTPTLEKISRGISTENNIDRIVIFYTDGTFNSYQMKKT
ncbi:bacteriophage CI repressor-like protein [Aquimarina sp. MAR_2010_214]|uniref:helix-turn-helix domain-containing protein n=1 Tax=Aquimarina sp. MAR_2010_214 TaxID=1250026 RepID=UPI000C706501|nr:helix-turn-helix transcriptional regulator [Aquimarina sp. MAR_2010_214]PKV51084.1 bacteriophage CI repressor-like protein [Aquimarina sp. MAR_2010_214]